MKKFLIGIVCLSVVVLCIVALQSEHEIKFTPEKAGEVRTVVWSEVNVREAAGTDNPILITIDEGTEVTLTGYTQVPSSDEKLWIEVSLKMGNSRITGWMRSNAAK